MIETWFQRLPLAAVFLLTLVTVLASLSVGYRLGLRRFKHVEKLDEGPIGSIVGAMLGLPTHRAEAAENPFPVVGVGAFTFGSSGRHFSA